MRVGSVHSVFSPYARYSLRTLTAPPAPVLTNPKCCAYFSPGRGNAVLILRALRRSKTTEASRVTSTSGSTTSAEFGAPVRSRHCTKPRTAYRPAYTSPAISGAPGPRPPSGLNVSPTSAVPWAGTVTSVRSRRSAPGGTVPRWAVIDVSRVSVTGAAVSLV